MQWARKGVEDRLHMFKLHGVGGRHLAVLVLLFRQILCGDLPVLDTPSRSHVPITRPLEAMLLSGGACGEELCWCDLVVAPSSSIADFCVEPDAADRDVPAASSLGSEAADAEVMAGPEGCRVFHLMES